MFELEYKVREEIVRGTTSWVRQKQLEARMWCKRKLRISRVIVPNRFLRFCSVFVLRGET